VAGQWRCESWSVSRLLSDRPDQAGSFDPERGPRTPGGLGTIGPRPDDPGSIKLRGDLVGRRDGFSVGQLQHGCIGRQHHLGANYRVECVSCSWTDEMNLRLVTQYLGGKTDAQTHSQTESPGHLPYLAIWPLSAQQRNPPRKRGASRRRRSFRKPFFTPIDRSLGCAPSRCQKSKCVSAEGSCDPWHRPSR